MELPRDTVYLFLSIGYEIYHEDQTGTVIIPSSRDIYIYIYAYEGRLDCQRPVRSKEIKSKTEKPFDLLREKDLKAQAILSWTG